MSTFRAGNILLPKHVDMTKWSVVACDQYTSEPEYWNEVEAIVGDAPSTLHITFPEIYLGQEGRIEEINREMKGYLEKGLFQEYPDAMIYVERDTGCGAMRRGLVGVIDLEEYDFHKGSKALIRATEGTVLDRIPPRVKIRCDAPLEIPHVMLLIDDPNRTVIEPLSQNCTEKVYDFDLMMDSGHLTGYLVDKDKQERISAALDRLAEECEKKHGEKLLFAVGDGNHSLATAKTCWETEKAGLTDEEKQTHPARYALVEIVNIHDESLEFEPIHRAVFDCEPENVIKELKKYYPYASEENNGGQEIQYTFQGKSGSVYVKDAPSGLTVGTLQNFLDEYITRHGGRIDYIHGKDVVERLSKQQATIGFYLPPMQKAQLFPAVLSDGALPRKTFSMGEAKEKRFYCECKRIR